MRVQDVMTEGVLTVPPTTGADTAWTLMHGQGIHHLVVTENRQVVGVLSERDTGGPRGTSMRKNRTVGDLMTVPVVTVAPATPVRKAANLMRGQSIGCLVVTERAQIRGIVTVADLLELIGRGIERPVAKTTRRTLSHRAPHRKRHVATGVW